MTSFTNFRVYNVGLAMLFSLIDIVGHIMIYKLDNKHGRVICVVSAFFILMIIRGNTLISGFFLVVGSIIFFVK